MTQNRNNPAVLIIGAGMTGIAVAIKLREAGISDITMLEKKASVGGTWRENTYPGVACDVPSHAYSYSFAARPEWSHVFAPGAEIHQYFIDVWQQFGLEKLTRFNEQVIRCEYKNDSWEVETASGLVLHADILFAATGMLHKPLTPDFVGKESFAGTQMHSAEWDHDVELEGKRIGVVGNGSSGVQLIGELVNMPGTDVTVFMRSPQWIIEVINRPYTARELEGFRKKPKRMQWVRYIALLVYERATTALSSDTFFNRMMHKVMVWNARRYMKRAIRDPELRQRLTPDYKFGCRRVVMNSTYYDAIQQPNAHLEESAIDRIETNGIRTRDGVLHELDVIVYATGFDPLAYMRPMAFTGRNGLSIESAWKKQVQAYRSLCLPGFPNFFLMLGPLSPIGNYSVIAISEIQADYCISLVKAWQAGRLDCIEVSEQAFQDWNADMKGLMKHTVWASGCQSWYLDDEGDPITWPDSWKNWVACMREPVWTDFIGSK